MTGDQLACWRIAHGWKQPEAAAQVGVPYHTYKAWERNRYPVPPYVQIITRYIDRYGVLPNEKSQ